MKDDDLIDKLKDKIKFYKYKEDIIIDTVEKIIEKDDDDDEDDNEGGKKETVLKMLGEGTFGTVYKGRIVSNNTEVAIKVMKEDLSENKEIMNEIEIMQLVDSFNLDIPKFYGLMLFQQQLAFVFSFLSGQTLDKYLESNKNLDFDKKLDLCIKAVEIISKLHARRIIHRDIKPENLMVQNDGTLSLLDFGISKICAKTVAATATPSKCTTRYAPREAHNNEGSSTVSYNVTVQFDIWSLGCLLYEVFSGEQPYKKFKDHITIMRNVMDPNQDFKYKKEFDQEFPDIYKICKNCLVKEKPEERYKSDELLDELKKLKK